MDGRAAFPGRTPAVPFVVYDAETVTRQYRRLRDFLDRRYPDSGIFYALKACYLQPVVRHLVGLGCGLEITTSAEQRIAAQLRLTGRGVIWNGPALDEETLRGAIGRGELINVDSAAIFTVCERIAREQDLEVAVGLRLNLGGGGKLGITPALAEPLLKSPRVKVTGFHIHHGAFNGDPSQWVRQRLDLLEVLGHWLPRFDVGIDYVDLGGGLLPHPEPELYLEPIIENVSRIAWPGRSRPRLLIEPGAYLVEEAGIAFTRVVAMKTVGPERWAITDLGSNFLIRLDRSDFRVSCAGRNDGEDRVSVGGNLCLEADVIARRQALAVTSGDVLKISRCGAYTSSMATCFATAPPEMYWRERGALERIGLAVERDDRFLRMHGWEAPVPC